MSMLTGAVKDARSVQSKTPLLTEVEAILTRSYPHFILVIYKATATFSDFYRPCAQGGRLINTITPLKRSVAAATSKDVLHAHGITHVVDASNGNNHLRADGVEYLEVPGGPSQ